MVQWFEEKAIGLRLSPEEWDLMSRARAKVGTSYKLFSQSLRWLESFVPSQTPYKRKMCKGKRDTVVWVKKEDYKKIEEKAKQLGIPMSVLLREIILKEAREILQEGGAYEKQTTEGAS